MNTRDKISKSIKYLADREESLSSFAKKIDASPQNVSNWIAGRSAPDIEKLADICRTCNVTMSSVFNGKPEFDYENAIIDSDAAELVEIYGRLHKNKREALLVLARSL